MSIQTIKKARRESAEAVRKFGPWDEWTPDGEECALNLLQETSDGDNYGEKWESTLPDKFQPYLFEIRLHIRQAHAKAMALAETLYETLDVDVIKYKREKGCRTTTCGATPSERALLVNDILE